MAKYEEIAEDIRSRILSGNYSPNEQLPLEKQMCESYGVSRITIKKAVDELVIQGWVIKRRGSGTFVKALEKIDYKKVQPRLQTEFYSSSMNNGNNVDAEFEMSEAAKTSLQYEALTNMLSRNYNSINMLLK